MTKKIILVTAVFIVLTSCAIKDLDPGEEAAYVSQLCSSVAAHTPSAENIIASDANQISYSDCMAEHGYLDRVSAD